MFNPSLSRACKRSLRNPLAGPVVALATGLTATSVVLAQAVPPLDAGAVLRQQDAPRTTRPAEAPTVRLPDAAARPGPAGAKVDVKAFRIEGQPKAFTALQIQAWLAPYVGRALSLAELQEAASVVSARYREAGYLVGGAVLPRQDVTDGTVALLIQEGLADPTEPIRLQGEGLRLRPRSALQLLSAGAPAGQALRSDALERALLLLNDLPGIAASASLEPGALPGTSRVVVNAREGDLVTAQAGVDNQGSRYTGATRVHAGLQINNPSGRGEQFSLAATASTEGNFQYLRLGLAQPLGSDGLRLGLGYSALRYTVGKELASLGAKGQAASANLSLRYPVLRSRERSLYASAGWDRTRVVNAANGADVSNKRLDNLNLGLAGGQSDSALDGGYWQGSATLSLGRLDLSAIAAYLAADQAGPNTQGSFRKLNLSVLRNQPLAPRLDLLVQAAGQKASRNLDSGEKLQLGGTAGVRAYASGEASGDDGLRASIETRYLALQTAPWGQLQVAAFYDWGQVQAHDAGASTNPGSGRRITLQGFGLGLQLTKPGTGELSLQWATQVGRNPAANAQGLDSDGRASKSRVWFNANLGF